MEIMHWKDGGILVEKKIFKKSQLEMLGIKNMISKTRAVFMGLSAD